MGRAGQASRILNGFMTPVSHPALPFKAAPGQLSAAEIRQGLSLMGEIVPKQFYLFGSPIAASKSPALHNTLFKETGLPHHYDACETTSVDVVKSKIRADDFGGASVTIPLKLDVMALLDEVDESARLIGAVNTIVPVPVSVAGEKKVKLVGRNTDYLGMMGCLRAAGASTALGDAEQSGLVIGGGGTARAAIHTLHTMGYKPIYLVGRDVAKIEELAKAFPPVYELVVLDTAAGGLEKKITTPPTVAIATIPANIPIDASLGGALKKIFSTPVPAASMPKGQGSSAPSRILLELAYKPAHTDVMKMAESSAGGGWKTIQGLETLVTQGEWQFEYWTGIKVRGLGSRITREVVLGANA